MLKMFAAIVLLVFSSPTFAAEDAARCSALVKADFGNILDAPTQVLDARMVGANEKHPAMCQVDGYVTPHVGFRIQLPTTKWNGKFIQIGCGGLCGRNFERYDADNQEKNASPMSCNPALRRGYACIRTDIGHQGGSDEAKWAYNNLQAQVDYGFRATHVTTLAGKAITEHFYAKAPAKSYFMGCSGGGLQGLSEAQRFPWDYDGIIAGAAPPGGLTQRSVVADLWTYLNAQDANGKPILDKSDVELLHRKVMAKCDDNDGVKDGLIGDPRLCKFDPSELTCTGNGGECLSAQKIETIKKIYSGPTAPGTAGFAGQTFGSELGWLVTIGGAGYIGHAKEGMRYLFLDPAPGPAWDVKDFDVARDAKRFGTFHALTAADNPDLRTFKAAGGKLIMFVGWADRARSLTNVDYYETVEKVMGGRANTQDFLRLFTIPGMAHCRGGEGPDAVDWLSALENWVEKTEAPDMVIAARFKPEITKKDFSYLLKDFPLDQKEIAFTRPIYPYPVLTKYKGSGDPTKAENFGPAEPTP